VLCESAVQSARTSSAAGGSWYNAIRSSASYKEDVYSREFDARAAEAIEQLTPADVANQFTTAWVTPTVGRQGRFQAIAPRGPGRRSPPPSIPTVLDPHRSQLGPAMPLMRPLPIKLPISGAGCPGVARPPRNPPSVPPSLPVPPARNSSSPRGLGPPVPEWMQHAEDRAAWRLPGTSTETSEPRWYEPRWQQRHVKSQYTTDTTLYDGAVGPDGTLFRPSTKSESRDAASDSHRDHASEFTRPPSPVGSSVTTSAVWRDPLGNVYESVYEHDPPPPKCRILDGVHARRHVVCVHGLRYFEARLRPRHRHRHRPRHRPGPIRRAIGARVSVFVARLSGWHAKPSAPAAAATAAAQLRIVGAVAFAACLAARPAAAALKQPSPHTRRHRAQQTFPYATERKSRTRLDRSRRRPAGTSGSGVRD
jgi:hypothetical protein